MVEGSLKPNITILGEKLTGSLKQVLYKDKNLKMPIKRVEMKISQKTKRYFFSFSFLKDHSTQKLGS